MEDFECIIPFETREGDRYVLQFSPFLPTVIPIQSPIIDISLVCQFQVSKVQSNRTFNFIIGEIKNYIENHPEVILYYYCDKAELFYRDTQHQSYQKYRNDFFATLFNKANLEGYELKSFYAEDAVHGDHYISLIFKQEHYEEINILENHLEDIIKK